MKERQNSDFVRSWGKRKSRWSAVSSWFVAGYASAISFTAAGIAVGASLASLAYNTFRIAERQGSDLMMAETTAQKLETAAQKLEEIYAAAVADLSAVRQELTAGPNFVRHSSRRRQ